MIPEADLTRVRENNQNMSKLKVRRLTEKIQRLHERANCHVHSSSVKAHGTVEFPDLTRSRTPHHSKWWAEKKKMSGQQTQKTERVGTVAQTKHGLRGSQKILWVSVKTLARRRWKIWECDFLKWLQVLGMRQLVHLPVL